jgi:trehalose 6-phosphate synthase
MERLRRARLYPFGPASESVEFMLMNVVVVSNRVARVAAGEPTTGGLASALLPAVKGFGAVWVGSSGKLQKSSDRDAFAEVEALGKGAVATVDLPAGHYAAFYEGFANSALWPVLHSRTDLICYEKKNYESYREVNRYMARALLRFCKKDGLFWIHDYHYLTLAEELRKLNVKHRIGFFLHTPWPEKSTIMALPQHRELITAMLAFDLIGFQTDEDLTNFASYLEIELGLNPVGGAVETPQGRCRLGVYPIGIDADEFAAMAMEAAQHADVQRLRESLQGRKLLIGVDRVDYSKGLLNRFRALDRLLTDEPALKRRISMLQIAVPSRSGIESYQDLQKNLAGQVGMINGKHAEADWTPIRYLNKAFMQSTLAGFYRSAAVGLVTSMHDGMNLVAKEYVAAQDPADPGVLVLSEFAGAARELEAALLVNPHDIDAAAHQLATAIRMPLAERQDRWSVMFRKLKSSSIHVWFANFLSELSSVSMPRIQSGTAFSALHRPSPHS